MVSDEKVHRLFSLAVYLEIKIDVRPDGTVVERLRRSKIVSQRRLRMPLVTLLQLPQTAQLKIYHSVSRCPRRAAAAAGHARPLADPR